MPAVGVGTPYSCYSLHKVAAGEKVFAYFHNLNLNSRAMAKCEVSEQPL